jgi:predicted dehydrogenase
MEPVRFAVIGLGGYGLVHIDAVRWLARQGLGKLTGVVALAVDRAARPDMALSLEQEGVRLFESVEQFMNEGLRYADVLTVPIGIHEHVPVSIAAMEAGLHVYCEKPVAGTIQEVDQLIAAKVRTGRQCAIGYQHVYSNSMQQLKARITGGRLGRLSGATILCGWPRSRQYYTRNNWAGKLRIGQDWILDSPANNANAHYLLNTLYAACQRPDAAAMPRSLTAHLYRANPMESTDTVQIKLTTDEDVRMHVILTHANGYRHGPLMIFTGDRGRAYWQTDEGLTVIRYTDGTVETFDNRLHPQWRYDGFRNLVAALQGKTTVLCPPELARAQTLAVNLMHESCPVIRTIDQEFVTEAEDMEIHQPYSKGMFRRVRDLDAAMIVADQEDAFFADLGVPWAAGMTGREVSGVGYTEFRGEGLR